jgi:hypothetical protein
MPIMARYPKISVVELSGVRYRMLKNPLFKILRKCPSRMMEESKAVTKTRFIEI